MDTIEKVYSEERAYRRAVGIEPVKMVSNLHSLAKSLFSSVRPEHELEQRCWDGAVKYRGSTVAMGGKSLTPVYDAYLEEARDIKSQAKSGGITRDPVPEGVEFHAPDTLEGRTEQIVSEKQPLKENAAKFKAMTKAELMLYLRDDGITHTMTAMRKMTKAKLETIAFMRSVVIPEGDEG